MLSPFNGFQTVVLFHGEYHHTLVFRTLYQQRFVGVDHFIHVADGVGRISYDIYYFHVSNRLDLCVRSALSRRRHGLSVRFQPVFTPTAIGYQWNPQRISVLHLFHHDAFNLLFLLGQHAEIEFVVYLKNHF